MSLDVDLRFTFHQVRTIYKYIYIYMEVFIKVLYIECQGSTNVKGYSTQKNDIWSLGVILINLTAGRNPWKQANMRNSTFAAYVRNPRHFFRTILPCISEELERILLRIFCLDPARRISLPELKIHIQKCVSFVHQPKDQQSLMMTQPKIKRTAVHPNLIPKSMCYSNSVAETMLHYVANFTDDDGILI
jgi:serine/threonine protein kinase